MTSQELDRAEALERQSERTVDEVAELAELKKQARAEQHPTAAQTGAAYLAEQQRRDREEFEAEAVKVARRWGPTLLAWLAALLRGLFRR